MRDRSPERHAIHDANALVSLSHVTVDPATDGAGEADEIPADSDWTSPDEVVQPILCGRFDWMAIGALFLISLVLVAMSIASTVVVLASANLLWLPLTP